VTVIKPLLMLSILMLLQAGAAAQVARQTNEAGQVFPAAGGKALYAFTGGDDGGLPTAPLVADRVGDLYGTTSEGGGSAICMFGCGTVFKLTAPSSIGGAWTESVVYAFTGESDGSVPYGGLIFDSAGNLYGTTSQGGDMGDVNCMGGNQIVGCGTVFELSPPVGSGGAWTEEVLYAFQGGSDGAGPQSSLVFDKLGNLYGTTIGGGDNSVCINCGTVFELSPSAGGPWVEAVILDFQGTSDGTNPYGPVALDKSGNVFGTTDSGPFDSGCGSSVGCGTVFELTPSGFGGSWSETVLHVFKGSGDGENPRGGLTVDASNNLYGTTLNGGTARGTAFQMVPPTSGGAWAENVIYDFPGGGAAFPFGFAKDKSGNLYGVTEGNSTIECGTVFELSQSGGAWTRTNLYSFTNQRLSQGCTPLASVVFGKGGALYGTTAGGGNTQCSTFGDQGCGTVFAVLP
jgi:uncharacterized repeat protein (TIGR03803 family)